MLEISPHIEAEITRHMETGLYASVDDLLLKGLELLSESEREEALRQYLIKAKTEGEDIEMTPTFWAEAIEEAMRMVQEKEELRRAS